MVDPTFTIAHHCHRCQSTCPRANMHHVTTSVIQYTYVLQKTLVARIGEGICMGVSVGSVWELISMRVVWEFDWEFDWDLP